MELALPLLTALVAGFAHALEPDHMAAVTTFVARGTRPYQALGYGVRWGIGHSGAILVVGMVLIVLDPEFPDEVSRGLEFGVGALLAGLGLWLLWSSVHARVHSRLDPGGDVHWHTHPHTHADGVAHTHPHAHARAPGWVGVAHGLAGTAPLVAILPVALIRDRWMAAGYLLLFSLGTVVAMGLYALIIGLLFERASRRSPWLATALATATALG
ncbi:MAG: hypothetical protein ICV87_13895, partial [Gemmatimonadetes bacterium]|nr:hypothetical protein [Gemmatimonadota bacterium]